MKKVYTIGEALIDFIPHPNGLLEKAPGGAPANVAAMVSLLGGRSAFIGKLSHDAFGDFLLDTINCCNVDTSHILRTQTAKTGLAFVTLSADGNRSFSFYRDPSADMLLTPEETDQMSFEAGSILHFCSVNLVECPTKHAHEALISKFRATGGFISFDPNVRLPLWHSEDACRETIQQFLPLADLLKISDEELSFITGIEEEQAAIESLFTGKVKMVLYTKGASGASLYMREIPNAPINTAGFPVAAIDTTGAGDAFIGAFLYHLSQLEAVEAIPTETWLSILSTANTIAARSTTYKGAISAYKLL